jgi:hypothetical protein
MSLYRSGLEQTIFEKTLVPGDYVHYDVAYETDVWQGKPKVVSPEYIPKQPQQFAKGGIQFGGDPHAQTINKISQALGELISNKQLINRRDWR